MSESAGSPFLDRLEEAIRAANREIIHRHIPAVSADMVLSLAVRVAELRADYLAAALRLNQPAAGLAPEQIDLAALGKRRTQYDEAVAAFEALRRAIRRGYVDLDE